MSVQSHHPLLSTDFYRSSRAVGRRTWRGRTGWQSLRLRLVQRLILNLLFCFYTRTGPTCSPLLLSYNPVFTWRVLNVSPSPFYKCSFHPVGLLPCLRVRGYFSSLLPEDKRKRKMKGGKKTHNKRAACPTQSECVEAPWFQIDWISQDKLRGRMHGFLS